MLATYGFHFERPWWLLTAVLVGPAIWLAVRSLKTMGRLRRIIAVVLRAVVMLLLVLLLAGPVRTRIHDELTLLAVLDRSQSVPDDLRARTHAYLDAALAEKRTEDQLAVIDVAEAALIARLPSRAKDVPKRNISLTGRESRLAKGVEMALAVAPPNTSVRVLLISDGNETAGDLKAVARVAAANRIPIDVLPMPYRHDKEVVFRHLVAPSRARSGQTVTVRFVVTSTHAATGRLSLTLNGRAVDLDPDSPEMTMPVVLRKGTNVWTRSLTVGTRGVHELDARFLPDEGQDQLSENNRASAVTFVAGPGHVLIASADPREAAALAAALREAKIDVREVPARQFPENITGLLGADAVVLVNTDVGNFSLAQQEMLCRYVTDLGGGLVTLGGPDSYGAGGWIGSPVARILPVDMDPPQKKQMPRGALVLIMHACEMPRGNYWGKEVAILSIRSLSRRDLAGVLDYGWGAGQANWVYPLSEVGDKKAPIAKIKQMQMGDMPDFGPPVQAAYQALVKRKDAAQKHIIIISDGDPTMPSRALLNKLKAAKITCTGVAVFPHSQSDVKSLQAIAAITGGRFYQVKDPKKLPQIFIKEAQVVRRSLIMEEPFVPRIAGGTTDMLRGVRSLPKLDGRVITGPKGGTARVLLAAPGGDPVLAAQEGVGRTVSFTSTADSRWASSWLGWGGFNRFWEQAVRWAARSAQASDCEVFADVHGRSVTLTVEAVDPQGQFVQFANLTGKLIAPDMTAEDLSLRQVGPGQYRANFQAEQGGSYLVNLSYLREGQTKRSMVQSVVNVPFAPEFEDLEDNSALLSELAATTGGRVLDLAADPAEAKLFQRAGLTPPRAPLPLVEPLFLAWVALFLLDVAIRRISLDFRAMARRVTEWLAHPRKPVESATLAALKTRSRTLRERLAGRKPDAEAARRYVAAEDAATELPEADVRKAPEKPRPEPPPEAPPAGQPPDETHVSRLLEAKRRAARRRKDDQK